MSNKEKRIFFGLKCEDKDEVDERLGYTEEYFKDIYPHLSDQELEDMMEGTYDLCETIFGDYFFVDHPTYYIGNFLNTEEEKQKQIDRIIEKLEGNLEFEREELDEYELEVKTER